MIYNQCSNCITHNRGHVYLSGYGVSMNVSGETHYSSCYEYNIHLSYNLQLSYAENNNKILL